MVLSKRYAKAYLESGKGISGPNPAASGAEKLRELERAKKATDDVGKILAHPLIPFGGKDEILEKFFFQNKIRTDAANFVRLLVKKNRYVLLPVILDAGGRILLERLGMAKAEAASAAPLSEQEIKRLELILKRISGKKAIVEQKISRDIIGGIEIRMGDILIDSTIKGRLRALKKKITTE